VDRRSRQPGASLYLVTTFAGERIAGNIAQLPVGVLETPGATETSYQHVETPTENHRALARIFLLSGGFRLLVGRDLRDRETLRGVLIRSLLTSLLWLTILGTACGIFVARRVLKRVDGMSASAQTIMAGDLARRLPLAGSNDELDRLAQNLNAMLDRITELMHGLREVSDNIAHDLRTPLTRLRNGAEEALRASVAPDAHRAALEKVIEESDGLIRVFNALLLIARAEAGAATEAMTTFDAGAVARDVVELYEPAAEEQGVAILTDISDGLVVTGHRELLGQALANLVDNAIKYGKRDGAGPSGATVRVASRHLGDAIEIEVSDRGPGIAPADRARVLERFVRLEGARSRPGSGLGLSLAAAAARMHHGALRIEDNAPGLRVVVALRAASAPVNNAPAMDKA
jgi:signal transduction histidine kinase